MGPASTGKLRQYFTCSWGDETDRVNRACVLTKRQGHMCQQVSIGPLKRLRFNSSTSLGAGRPKYKCPATSNRFDSSLYMCDGRLQASGKWLYPHIVRTALPLNFDNITLHTAPSLTANKSLYTCLIAFYFGLDARLSSFNKWVDGNN